MNDEEIGPWRYEAAGRPMLSPRRLIRPPIIRLKRHVRPTQSPARPTMTYPRVPCLSVFTPRHTQGRRPVQLSTSHRASSCSHRQELGNTTGVDLEKVKKTLLKLNRSPKPAYFPLSFLAHYSSASLFSPSLSPKDISILPTPRLRYRKQAAADRERRELNSWDCGVIAEQWSGALQRLTTGKRRKSSGKREEKREKVQNLGEVLGNMMRS